LAGTLGSTVRPAELVYLSKCSQGVPAHFGQEMTHLNGSDEMGTSRVFLYLVGMWEIFDDLIIIVVIAFQVGMIEEKKQTLN
jgi:hypothetical protein